MVTRKSGLRAMLTGLLMLGAGLAADTTFAQSVYRCKSGNSTFVSDRPCPAGTGSTLGVAGATPTYGSPTQASSYQRPSETPEHTRYLSAACADISEAIRTGPSRGVRGDVLSGLHREYREKCADEDQAARQRVYEEQRRQRDDKRSAQAAERQQQQQARLTQEQCSEMLRILAGKRQHAAAMNEGERGDLQRFEANYAERCKR